MSNLSTVRIEIGGRHVPIFSRVSVRQWIDRHHTFELTVPIEQVEGEGGMTINQSKNFIGQTARITIRYRQGAGDSFVFRGFVTQLYLSKQASSGSSVVIRGSSASILLEQGSRFKAFYQYDHSQIVNIILKEYDLDLLQPSVSPRATRKEDYVVKFNETSYNFLHRFAAATGNWFYFDGEKTVFGDVPNESPIRLTYGEDMNAFDMQMSLPGGEFFINDYNPMKDENAKSHSKDVRVSGLGEYGQFLIDKAENLYPERTYSRPPLPALTDADAKLFAGYEKKASVANAVIFSGSSNKVGLKLGSVVTVGEESGMAGQRTASFGQYRIISISHDADLGGGYSNRFEAIPAGVEFRTNPSFYVPRATMQTGTVLHNDDPEHLGRVRVLFDWQEAQGDAESSTWIRVLAPQNFTADQGVYFVPEVSNKVMVLFENEDPARPVVAGVTYDKSTKQNAFYSQDNLYKTIITKGGNHIVIGDEKGKEFISLYNRDKKNHIKLSLDSTHITVKSEGTINLEADTINLKASKFNVDASDEWNVKAGKADMQVNGDLSIDAIGTASLSGNETDIGGLTTTINGKTSMKVSSSAMLELDGGPMTTLKGAMVMIN
ncbi:type VI secretion system Vgr family protein [Fibrella aquatica]|uniref:type VI secretion system Vgr family protein n=1 Tax=Fibrella aquatica TaxID=3242487 RepID=UPI003520273A